MNFVYQQSTGRLTRNGVLLSTGYSGHGDGLNNPAMQNIVGVGPLPQGMYTIQPPTQHPKLGPIAMALLPHPDNIMYGRSGFFMHGDNTAMNHTASDGCIIQPPTVRNVVAGAVAAGEDQLEVIA